MSMITPTNAFIFTLISVFIITFVFGFISGKNYMKNIRSPMIQKKEREERAKRELSDFYENIRRSAKDLEPFLETLEMVIHDAINELPLRDSEGVCSTYNYYIRVFREVRNGMKVSDEDLINLAHIHSEYSRIVSMYKRTNTLSVTDFDKISLN